MSLQYLQRKRETLLNAIAFNVSCPEMVAYQRELLARIEYQIANLAQVQS